MMLTKPFDGRMFFEAEKGDAGGNGGTGNEDGNGANPDDANAGGEQGGGFTPITDEAQLSAYKASLRKAIAADVRRELEAEQQRREAQAQADRERAEAEKRGEFETVKTSLTQERDAAITERDTLKATIAAYEALATARVETVKGDIPAEALEDFPADADPLAQLTWLETRAKLVAKLVPANAGDSAPRLPKTPEANGAPTGVTKEQQAAFERQYRRF